jgi:hypothetical protein
MIGQSNHWAPVTSYIVHSFLHGQSLLRLYQPQQTVQFCWAKTISQSQTSIFWLFLHPIVLCVMTYWAPLEMLLDQIHPQLHHDWHVLANFNWCASGCWFSWVRGGGTITLRSGLKNLWTLVDYYSKTASASDCGFNSLILVWSVPQVQVWTRRWRWSEKKEIKINLVFRDENYSKFNIFSPSEV